MATIEFFYDFSSPYSYLAAMKLPEVARNAGATLLYRPFVLGAVFKAAGNHMPAEVAAKAAYQLKDLSAWARDYGVPFNFPDSFPINAIKAARMVVALETEGERAKLTERIYKAYWGENTDITDARTLVRLANEAGFNGDVLVGKTEQQEIKDRLRANTDDAIARGSFGAPTMLVGDQMFIGNDRLAFVERAAKGEQIYR